MILDGMAWPGRGYGTLEPLPMTLGQRGSPCFLAQVSSARVCVRCGAVRGEFLLKAVETGSSFKDCRGPQMLSMKLSCEDAPSVSFALRRLPRVPC